MDSNIIITNSDAQYTFSSNLRLGIYEWFGLEKWKVHDLVSPQSRGKFPSLPPLLLRPKSAARRLQCSMNSNEIPGNHCETTMSSPPLKPLGPQVDPQHADPTFRQQLEETSDIRHRTCCRCCSVTTSRGCFMIWILWNILKHANGV